MTVDYKDVRSGEERPRLSPETPLSTRSALERLLMEPQRWRWTCLLGFHRVVPDEVNARYDVCRKCRKRWRVA